MGRDPKCQTIQLTEQSVNYIYPITKLSAANAWLDYKVAIMHAGRGGRVVSASASESVVHRFEYRRRHLVDA